jgi:hypothetical protein
VLFILGRQSLELARIKPDAVALVAAIDLDAFVNDLNKRALTLRTMNRRSLCLFLGALRPQLFDQLLFLAMKVFLFERFLSLVSNLRHMVTLLTRASAPIGP